MSRRILIVGGAVAGPAAVIAARGGDKQAEIVLLERGQHVGYATGGLAYTLSGEVKSIGRLVELSPEVLRRTQRVDVRLGVELTAVDPAGKTIAVESGGRREIMHYDKLIVAAGARSCWPALPPADAPNVFKFRSLADIEAIGRYRRRHTVRQVVVVGGGYIGLEAAEGFRRSGCRVSIVEKTDHVLDGFPDAFYRLVEDRLRRAGTKLHKGVTATSVSRDKPGAVKKLTLSSGSKVSADLVVVTAGVTPNAEILLAAGAQVGPNGSVLVDACLRTSLPDVFAVGVCAALPSAITGEPVWFAQAGPAHRSGAAAGHNAVAAATDQRRVTILETALLRVFDCALGRTGLDEAAAVRWLGSRKDLGEVEATLPARDGYFSDPAPLRLRLLFSKPGGRILGAQVFGALGVDKIIDTLATAITAGMSLSQLAEVDLAYSPPFAPLPSLLGLLVRRAQ
jgi:NADPH-dependent 2,4-dienoyl-CoA reductase/sulfur reductase-like enzyme